MLAVIQEREWEGGRERGGGPEGVDIRVWLLAELTLDFLLSLGLTAVRAPNTAAVQQSQ